MKSQIWSRPIWLVVGVMASLAGCRSIPTHGTSQAFCDPPAGTKLDKFTDKIAEDIRTFDQEQLHPIIAGLINMHANHVDA